MDLAERRKEHLVALDAALGKAVEVLKSFPGVKQVILFGSYARGRRDLFTDLDFLVVMESDLDFLSRLALLRQALALPVDFDLLVYTPQEIERLKDRPFFKKALQEGKVLYEKEC
ncbi:nucleotidyltransferase domain-containing protein [Atrimonas thermophila]|uniref:nucleotidyltransferase domain-containing protein n=1 Tax=Atrimonas thermophila TaxID=3064161 RepID=UPI00399D34B4